MTSFDDFLRELNERQGKATGGGEPRRPDDGKDHDDAPSDPDDDVVAEAADDAVADAADDADATPAGERTDETPASDDADETSADETDDDGRTEEPIVLPPAQRGGGGRRGGGGGRPPKRPAGGPNDGGSSRSRAGRLGPQVLLVVVGLILFAAVFLVGAGLDLATDAIWFKSVGYDPVFWTTLGSQVGLFLGGLIAALIFLLANLWLAGRLAPPPDAAAGERVRGIVGRLGDAARSSTEGQWGRGDPFGGPRRGAFGRTDDDRPARSPITFEAEEIPDLSPLAIAGLVVVAILAALGVAGALAGSWETVLLWQHQVPTVTAAGSPVVDPVFGRDVSYYLFQLPFLRLVQATVGGLLIAALIVAGGRYLLAAARGGGFPTPVRVHLGILGGLYLLTVAAGYQLDKLELVYSARGVATGVSFTDQAALFFAFDALTIVAGVVAALLVGGAFTRWIWPLGAGIAVWFGLSILLGQVYPEIIQRFTVEPNEYAKEQPYIVNNVNMTRLSYGVDQWEDKSYQGDAPLTAQDLVDEKSTFTNARLWDYRPLQTTLDQIQTLRQYYDFVDVDVDRYPVGSETRQVMLSARELAPAAEHAGRLVGQPADRLHPRLRDHHGPGQRGRRAGPAEALDPRHAAALDGGRPDGDPAADLLRRAPQRLDRGRRAAG